MVPTARDVPIDQVREPYLAENERLGAQGLRVMATAQRDFDPATFDPNADLLPLVSDLQLLAHRRHRRPAARRGPRRHRQGTSPPASRSG